MRTGSRFFKKFRNVELGKVGFEVRKRFLRW